MNECIVTKAFRDKLLELHPILQTRPDMLQLLGYMAFSPSYNGHIQGKGHQHLDLLKDMKQVLPGFEYHQRTRLAAVTEDGFSDALKALVKQELMSAERTGVDLLTGKRVK